MDEGHIYTERKCAASASRGSRKPPPPAGCRRRCHRDRPRGLPSRIRPSAGDHPAREAPSRLASRGVVAGPASGRPCATTMRQPREGCNTSPIFNQQERIRPVTHPGASNSVPHHAADARAGYPEVAPPAPATPRHRVPERARAQEASAEKSMGWLSQSLVKQGVFILDTHRASPYGSRAFGSAVAARPACRDGRMPRCGSRNAVRLAPEIQRRLPPTGCSRRAHAHG